MKTKKYTPNSFHLSPLNYPALEDFPFKQFVSVP